MTQVINISGKDVAFKATGSTLRRYREKFGRDLFKDFTSLTTGELTGESMEILQNFAYIMAKQADEDIPDDVSEWLDSFETFPFDEIAQPIVILWQKSNITNVTPKKATGRRAVK